MDTEFISITHEIHAFYRKTPLQRMIFDLFFSLIIYSDAVSSKIAAVGRK